MTVQEFFDKYNGVGIDYDHFYGFQCVDLADQYASEVVGHNLPAVAGAKDFWTHTIDGYDKIANTPDGVPQKGDIIIWGTGVGQYGHVAVFDHGDSNSFTSFDQNWPLNSLCHFQNHNYNGVLGWFHPQATLINVPLNQLVITDQTKIPLGDQLGEIEVQAIRSELLDSRNQLGDKDTQIHVLQQRLNECCAKLVEIQDNPVLPITQPVATVQEDTIPEPTVNSSLTTISSLFSKMLGWFGL